MVRIGVYEVSLVRDGSVPVESRLANEPRSVAAIVRSLIGDTDREHFLVLMLDSRYRVIGVNTVSVGTLTASLVHPRETFKPAILAGAAAIVVAHNHPSGECSPSPEDVATTRRLAKAGELLGIGVLDHVIVTTDGHYSMREAGVLS